MGDTPRGHPDTTIILLPQGLQGDPIQLMADLLLIQECPQVVATPLVQVTVVIRHPHTVDPMGITEVQVTPRVHTRLHKDQDGPLTKAMAHHQLMAAHHRTAAERRQAILITGRGIMDPVLGSPQEGQEGLLLRLQPQPLRPVVRLQADPQGHPLGVDPRVKDPMGSSRHITISISLSLDQALHRQHQGDLPEVHPEVHPGPQVRVRRRHPHLPTAAVVDTPAILLRSPPLRQEEGLLWVPQGDLPWGLKVLCPLAW